MSTLPPMSPESLEDYQLKRIRRLEESHARLLEACRAVAGVFRGHEDMPLYARRCIAAIAEAEKIK